MHQYAGMVFKLLFVVVESVAHTSMRINQMFLRCVGSRDISLVQVGARFHKPRPGQYHCQHREVEEAKVQRIFSPPFPPPVAALTC